MDSLLDSSQYNSIPRCIDWSPLDHHVLAIGEYYVLPEAGFFSLESVKEKKHSLFQLFLNICSAYTILRSLDPGNQSGPNVIVHIASSVPFHVFGFLRFYKFYFSWTCCIWLTLSQLHYHTFCFVVVVQLW